MTPVPTLHMLCGKIAAGKSTLCRQLGAAPLTVIIAQDPWMKHLYPDEVRTVDDYLRYVPRLNRVMALHVADLLRAGLSVVLDFPANRVASRRWMREAADAAGAPHRLHFLDTPDDVCRERLKGRNASGTHEYVVSDAEFDAITALFEPPTEADGLEMVVHRPGG
jgi:predicted kinase